MTHVMSYVILLAAAIGACAAVLEGLLERRTSSRWIWLTSLVATMGVTVLAMCWPGATASQAAQSPALLLGELSSSSLPVTRGNAPMDLVTVTDAILPLAWLLGSAGLLVMIALGQHRLRRVRVRAQQTELAGHPALLTDTIGPAVAGLRNPVVFVPKWVLALDEPSQRLLMAHEVEHVRKRDTTTLFAGALGVALMPWNPVVWWTVRRLRLAVEQDCDARVLASHPGVRRYADLLLVAASRHGLTTRLLAAHFGEHSSDLMRRIDTMTRRREIVWRRVAPATAIAALLIAGACETPRPDPVAPITVGDNEAKKRESFTEVEKDRASQDGFSVVVLSSDGTEIARYAGEIPVAHLPKDGVQSVKADERTCGTTRCYEVRITLKAGAALDLNELEVDKFPLKRLENEVNLIRDVANKVRETSARLQEGIDPTNAGAAREGGEGKRLAFSVTRDRSASSVTEAKETRRMALGTGLRERADFELLSKSGEVVSRYTTDTMTKEVRVEDIDAIEVFKSSSCSAGTSCSLVRITLKPGREGAYRK
jgi:beta-lactamase regulating signal transducer with metallopeptidase domain